MYEKSAPDEFVKKITQKCVPNHFLSQIKHLFQLVCPDMKFHTQVVPRFKVLDLKSPLVQQLFICVGSVRHQGPMLGSQFLRFLPIFGEKIGFFSQKPML
jgi:hypothetical protein